MKKRYMAFAAGLAVSLYCGVFSVEAGADSQTLFEVRFDAGLDADVAKGSKALAGGRATLDPAGHQGSALCARQNLFEVLQYSTADNINPLQGTIEMWFKPELSRNRPDMLTIYRIFASWDEKAKEGIGLGLNHYPKGDTYQLWFYLFDERREPKSFGVDQVVSIKKGQWYHIAVCWDEKRLSLYLDEKLLGVKEKKGPIAFGETFTVGGDVNLKMDPADGLIDEFRISYVPRYEMPFSPVQIEMPGAQGNAQMWGFWETDKLIWFVVEANSPVRLTVRPKLFPVSAGQDYMVNSSFFDPMLVRAIKDGSLTFEMDSPHNCTVQIERPTGGNLLPNASFEAVTNGTATGWLGLADESASAFFQLGYMFSEGNYQGLRPTGVSSNVAPLPKSTSVPAHLIRRSGRYSFLLSMSQAHGEVKLESAEAIPLQAGKEYLLSGYYNLENASFGSEMHFIVRLTCDGTQRLPYDPQEWLLNPLIATGPTEWRRSFVRFKVPEDWTGAKARVIITGRGAPFKAYWDDLALQLAPVPANQAAKSLTPIQIQPRHGPDEIGQIMQTREAATAKLTTASGLTRLLVDGQIWPLFGYVGSPYLWPKMCSHSDLVQAGVHLHFVPLTPTGPLAQIFGDPPIWLGDGRYDFSTLDRKLTWMLGYDINARIMLYLHMDPYPEFGDQHPEAVCRNAQGQKTIGTKGAEKGAEQRGTNEAWNISYTAGEFRRQGSDFLRALAQHLNNTDLGKAVIGVHLTCGSDGQWFSFVWPDWQDNSPAHVESFREWLPRRYNNNLKEFRKAWGDATLRFETAPWPPLSARATDHSFYNANLGSDRRLIDAGRFNSEGVAETINLFARTFKETMRRPVLVGTYYSDISHGHGVNHNALKVLLDQPDLDGIVSVMEYGMFRTLGRTGCLNSVAASIRLHNKYFLAEIDHRTDYSYLPEDCRRDYGVPKGVEATKDQLRRDVGMSLCQGTGNWIYGLSGNAWAGEGYIAALAEVYKAAEAAALFPMPSDRGQMAVYCDEQLLDHASTLSNFNFLLSVPGHYSARNALNRSGLAWDEYLLSDLDNPKRPDYKIHLFLSSVAITPDQIEWVQRNLQKDGRVLVFVNAAGFSLGKGFEENILRLTGMHVKMDTSQPCRYRFAWLNDPMSETSGPLFYVDDPTATPLAQAACTNRTVVAMKHFQDWTSVYIALPGGFNPQILRQIAAEAKVTPVGPEGDATYAGNGFLVIHALSAGEKTLRWNGKSDLLDIASGKIIASGQESITFPMTAFSTRWFRRIPVK